MQNTTIVPVAAETVPDALPASEDRPRGRFRSLLTFAQYRAWCEGAVSDQLITETVGWE